MYTVYMHVNKTNQKKYIGITSQKPEHRWKYGKGYSEQVFYSAILKYGWDGFDHVVLFAGLTEEAAKIKEAELIKYYRTFIGFEDCQGYNMTLGGEGNSKYQTEEDCITARREGQARSRARVKAEPEKYQQRLEQMRDFKKQYYNDPVMHEKLLAANRKCHEVKRSTPEGRAEDNAATYKLKCDVKQIRLELKALYQQYPEFFSEEDYHIVFDRRQTPNKSWVFTYTSKTKLNSILANIKEKVNIEINN